MNLPSSIQLNFGLIALAGLCFTGCDGRPKRVPIAGTVLIDGQPLKGGQIRIFPDTARSAQSMIDSEGHFELFTFETGDGAVLGEHRVEIKSAENVPGGVKWLVPKKYTSFETSGITIKVDKPNKDLRIELTWDGSEPFIERADNTGDAPPVVVPQEPSTTPAEAP